MAAGLYDSGREGFLVGEIDWDGPIRVSLIDEALYTPSLANHKFVNQVAGIIANSVNFTGKTNAAGVANAASAVFSTVPLGNACEGLLIYQWAADSTTARLIAYINTGNATGLPVTPNGGDITVNWDTGANKVFKL